MSTTRSPDPKAVQLTSQVHDLIRPQMTLLFGSRARGDHRPNSDVDILVVTQATPPTDEWHTAITKAEQIAQAVYTDAPQLQFTHRTSQDFMDQSRNRNNMVSRAADEGAHFTNDPMLTVYLASPRQYESAGDQETAKVHIQRAQAYLDSFTTLVSHQMTDEGIGAMAHAALCQALKAAIAASGHRYQAIHDVDRLHTQFLDIHLDSLLRASISPAIYQQYRDYGANHPAVMPITAVEDYQAQVTQEVQSLLALARDTINSGGQQTAPP